MQRIYSPVKRREYYLNSKDKIREYNFIHRKRNTEKAKEWAKNNPKKRDAKSMRHKSKYPEKYKALRAVELMRKSGLKYGNCEVCGISENIQAHHDDYSKPKAIRFLCIPHHVDFHRGHSYDPKSFTYIKKLNHDK